MAQYVHTSDSQGRRKLRRWLRRTLAAALAMAGIVTVAEAVDLRAGTRPLPPRQEALRLAQAESASSRPKPAPPLRTLRRDHADDHVLVKVTAGARTALAGQAQVEPVFGRWYRVGLRADETVEQAIARLRRTPGVLAAEPDHYLRSLQVPNDPIYPQQWNFPMVQAQAAWAQSTGTGVTVAVLDTGMSTLANDFVASHVLSYPSPYGTSNDLNGHGTHVSGTIAQATNNAIGTAGLAYGANVRALKVLADSGTGLASHIAQGIYDSALTGDEVINMSLGMPCTANWPACSTLVVNDAIQEAVDRDVVIIAASGNDNAPFVSFPANHPNLIAVGAVDTAQARAPYSNHGCALSLVAPGGTTSPNVAGGIYQQTYFNGTAQVRPFQGTSMAAPHVAAAAAILRAKYPNATALQVRSALQAAALDLGATGRDNLFGNGLLKVNTALAALQANPPALAAADVCGNALLVPNPPVVTNAIDLRVASINVAGATVDPQTFLMGGTAVVAIANWGNVAPSSSYTIALFEDSNANGNVDTGEQLASFTCLSTNTACAIAPFGAAAFAIPLAGTLDFRDRRISAFVDSQGQVAESDETNNVGMSLGVCGVSTALTIQPVQMWSAPTSTTLGLGAPIVADLNQDGVPEVIYADGGGPIRALNGATGANAFFFTSPTLGPPGFFFDRGYTPAVGNLDSDPFLELVAIEQNTAPTPDTHTIHAYEHNGSVKWTVGPFPGNTQYSANPALPTIADLDGDGVPEVIAAGRVLNGTTGAVLATLNTGPTILGGAPIAVNLDTDPELEIVIGNLAFNSNGSPLWANTSPLPGFDAVVDFDGDGQPDILQVARTSPDPTLRLYRGNNGTPHLAWTVPTLPAGSYSTGPAAVADVDGDGNPEVAVIGNQRLLVYRKDGTPYWNLPIAESPGTPGVTAFDFNQDGAWELLANSENKFMIIADIGGAPVVVWSAPTSSQTWHEYPVVADIDGDGHADILFRAHNGTTGPAVVTAFRNANSDWPATRPIWNQHAYHAENVGANGQIPATLPANWWADNQFLVNSQPAPAGTGPDLTAGRINATANTLSAVVGNAGSSAANPVWVAFYDGAPGSGGTLIGTVNIGTLAPGQFATATVPHGLSGAHNIHVVADRNGGGVEFFAECNEANNKHSRQLTFVPVDVRITKTVSPSALIVGQGGTYTLQVASLSAANSQNTVVKDILPAGIQVTGISYSPASCTWTSSQAGQVLTFVRPAGIGAGQVCTITIGVNATSAAQGTVVQNVATLTDDFDSQPSNNQSSVTHAVVGTQSFDLRVVKSTTGAAVRGTNLTYVVTAHNVGTTPAGGLIEIVDTMNGGNSLIALQPPSTWHVLVNGGLRPIQTAILSGPWTCAIQSSFWGFYEQVRCVRNPLAPPIAPGAIETMLITARIHAIAGSSISNTATLTAPNDSNPTNNQAVKIDLVP